LSKSFIRINELKEKIIYLYCLSVNYNNRSLAVGNDSQNGIIAGDWQRAAIIHELNIHSDEQYNSWALFFIDHNMVI